MGSGAGAAMTEASACRWSVYVVRSTGARECVDDRLTAGEAKSAAADCERGELPECMTPLTAGDRVELVEEPEGHKGAAAPLPSRRPNPDIDALVAEASAVLERIGERAGQRGYDAGEVARAISEMWLGAYVRGQREWLATRYPLAFAHDEEP